MERLDAGRVPCTLPFAHVQALETQACPAFSLFGLKLHLCFPCSLQLEDNWPPGHWLVEQR